MLGSWTGRLSDMWVYFIYFIYSMYTFLSFSTPTVSGGGDEPRGQEGEGEPQNTVPETLTAVLSLLLQ